MKRAICILYMLILCTAAAAGDGLRLTSVTIDPGHGGKDVGAVSKDKKNYEKTFTLDISKKLAAMIAEGCPEVKVNMTRTKDEFVSLQDRAVKANRAGSQLFISIHINSTVKPGPNGFSVHILGQSSNKDRDLFAYNMDVCRRENSVIMLEEDYSTKYEGFDPDDNESYIFMTLMQNANLEQSLKFAEGVRSRLKGGPVKADRGVWQNPFYVLWKTSMPAVLVELGFISNDADLAVLRDESRRKELAARIYKAFLDYKRAYDSSVAITRGEETVMEEEAAPVPVIETVTDPSPEAGAPAQEVVTILYGVQVIATGKTLPAGAPILMGYEPKIVKAGGINKYIIAVSDDLQTVRSALSEIRKKSPDSFIVKIENGSAIRLR